MRPDFIEFTAGLGAVFVSINTDHVAYVLDDGISNGVATSTIALDGGFRQGVDQSYTTVLSLLGTKKSPMLQLTHSGQGRPVAVVPRMVRYVAKAPAGNGLFYTSIGFSPQDNFGVAEAYADVLAAVTA